MQVKSSQDLNHKLKEDLLHSGREYNRIHRCVTFSIFSCAISSFSEQNEAKTDLSSAVPPSKYMEKQIQAKTMLHQTKQKLFKETAQRSSIIQKLEKEVIHDSVAVGLAGPGGDEPHSYVAELGLRECVGVFQVKRLICTLTEEREKSLEERRELLQKINKLEEEGVRTTSTVQHRCVSAITLEIVASTCVTFRR